MPRISQPTVFRGLTLTSTAPVSVQDRLTALINVT